MRLNAGARLGPYEVVAAIGQGGMGEVYRAIDTRLGRVVAIKVIRADLRDGSRERFEQEARMVASLNHPHVCTLYDVGRHDDHEFLVMEFLEGQTLHDRLSGGPLPPQEVDTYARQLAAALAAAHAKGLIHRDLKPANVFLTTDNVVKILDFGIAKRAEGASEEQTIASDTEPGTFLGSAGYAAPEQLRGEPVTPATDLFSLGAVLHEMLTGTAAFHRTSVAESLAAVLREDPPLLPAGIPPALSSAVARCLRKNASERFQTAREFLIAIDRPLASIPVAAHPVAPSIAVLPFADLSAEHDQEFFCDGISDELITALMSLDGVRVASRTSAFQFKGQRFDIADIGRRLKVQHVLEGSVRRAGNRLRVTVQLTDVNEGFQAWSERYDRAVDDVFAVQDDIARSVVEKLKLGLGRVERPLVTRATKNMDAYNRYLLGRHLLHKLTPDGLAGGMDRLREAVALQPDYADAHATLAYGYLLYALFSVAPPRQMMPLAKAAAEQALHVNPNLAAGHLALATVQHWYDWDFAVAEKSYLRAIELSPADAIAHFNYCAFLTTPGLGAGDAIAQAQRAIDLDPVSPIVNRAMGDALYMDGRFDEAIAHVNRMLAFEPTFFSTYWILGLSLAAKGKYREAVEALDRGRQYSHGDPPLESFLGWAAALAGDTARAQTITSELEARRAVSYVSGSNIGLVYQGLGDMDTALTWYSIAVNDRSGDCLAYFKSPHYAAARRDDRFLSLLKTIESGTRGLGV